MLRSVFHKTTRIMSPQLRKSTTKALTESNNENSSKRASEEKLNSKNKRKKHITPEYETGDISHKTSQPNDWQKVLDHIREMRIHRDAPVDEMGCGQCPDKDETPAVKRFQTLVSLMLSSQTKDQVTHAAMLALRDHTLTVDNIINTPDEVLGKLIYPCAFWKKKVGYIKKTCQILKEKYEGDIPDTIEGLCSLPGVGKKMAYLCMDIGWGRIEGIGVDTHVHRISNRLGWTLKPTKQPEDTRKALESWLPNDLWREVNILMVGFGQQICLPIRPKCNECTAKHLCPHGKNSSPSPKKSSK